MVTKVSPAGMLLMMLAGWINRRQQDVIACLKEENKTSREKLGTKRIPFGTLYPSMRAEHDLGTHGHEWFCSKAIDPFPWRSHGRLTGT